MCCTTSCFSFFFFNDTATTEIYTLSLHDALPISLTARHTHHSRPQQASHVLHSSATQMPYGTLALCVMRRSEEHTSELQSHSDLVCRLLLEKKKRVETQRCTLIPRPQALPRHKCR